MKAKQAWVEPEDISMAAKPETATVLDRLKAFWRDFALATTCHGVRYVYEARSRVGRFVWLIVVLWALGFFCYQAADRIRFFYQWPVSVDIEVAYNDTLPFPAVAICNSNQFRYTEALNRELFDDLTKYFSTKDSHLVTKLDDHDMGSLMWQLGSRIEDMLMSCEWKGEVCYPENFTALLTDDGLCYVFNLEHPVMMVDSTGAGEGFQVEINTEHYEHMIGPQSTSGIKVLVYDQFGIPRVSDLGISVSSFKDARIGLQMSVDYMSPVDLLVCDQFDIPRVSGLGVCLQLQGCNDWTSDERGTYVQNLPAPYGTCASQDELHLKHHDHYSFAACQSELLAEAMIKTCGCIPYYIPWKGPGRPPNCTFSALFGCALQVGNGAIRGSECRHPCRQMMYSTDVSYADISPFMAGTLAQKVREDKYLKEKYRKARIRKREHDPTMKEMDDERLYWMQDKGYDFNDAVGNINKTIKILRNHVKVSIPKILEPFKDAVVANNVQRSRDYGRLFHLDILESYLKPQVFTFRYKVKDTLKQLKALKRELNKPNVSRDALANLGSKFQKNKVDAEKLVIDDVTEEMVTVLPEASPTAHDQWEAIVVSGDQEKMKATLDAFIRFGKNATRIMAEHIVFVENLEKACNSGPDDAKEALSTAKETLRRLQMRHVVFNLSMSLDNLTESVNDAISAFRIESQFYMSTVKNIKMVAKQMVQGQATELLNGVMAEGGTVFIPYAIEVGMLLDSLDKDEPRMEQLINITSHVNFNLDSDSKALGAISSRIMNILDHFQVPRSSLLQHTHSLTTRFIMNDMSDDAASQAEEDFETVEAFLDAVNGNITQFMNEARQMSDSLVNLLDATFDLFKSIKSFMNSLVIGEEYVRDNILSVNVFYQRLSYQDIHKRIGYGLLALMSDIGGSAGLFLGASVLTVLELFYFMTRRLKDKMQAPPENTRSGALGQCNTVFSIT